MIAMLINFVGTKIYKVCLVYRVVLLATLMALWISYICQYICKISGKTSFLL